MSKDLLDQYKGGLFGLAVGDALGATLEFTNREEIRQKYGIFKDILGGGWLNLEPGAYTDDTEMTLAVARGILDNPNNPYREIGRCFVTWYDTKPKDIGNIIKTAIYNFKKCDSWAEASQKTHLSLGGRSAGNGSLMRTLPISFAYWQNKSKMCRIAVQVSHMTHYDQQAAAACVFYNLLIGLIISGENYDKGDLINIALIEAKKYCESSLPPLPKNYWQDIAASVSLTENQVWASGYVLDSLIAALWSFYHSETFEESIIKAVNLGDDSDTVGAICGGLAGTYFGYNAIPERWLKVLKNKHFLDQIAQNLRKLVVT
ncbi:ADP-ribosylglycohydrolase family protein [Desulfolucanica intricata]|uniref:ADP-ribosylglycohydrolase family protein n=1 Tax=Desulfolucanica intricata TaxID=1285191 RepID=UPI00082DE254|nr:ADP-ribosylglycohydrolase family protein [Desulfolucanica intricata]